MQSLDKIREKETDMVMMRVLEISLLCWRGSMSNNSQPSLTADMIVIALLLLITDIQWGLDMTESRNENLSVEKVYSPAKPSSSAYLNYLWRSLHSFPSNLSQYAHVCCLQPFVEEAKLRAIKSQKVCDPINVYSPPRMLCWNSKWENNNLSRVRCFAMLKLVFTF